MSSSETILSIEPYANIVHNIPQVHVYTDGLCDDVTATVKPIDPYTDPVTVWHRWTCVCVRVG